MSNIFDSDWAIGITYLAGVIVTIIFYVGIVYYGSITAFLNVLNSINNNIFYFFSFDWINFSWINSYIDWIALVLMIISFTFIIKFTYKNIKYFIVWLITLISEYLEEKRFIANKRRQIETIRGTEVNSTLEGLKNETGMIRDLIVVSKSYKPLNCFTKELEERLKTCLKLLEKLKLKYLTEITKKGIDENERRNKEQEEQNRINETYNEDNYGLILYKLNAEDKFVFIKEKLSKNQIKALKSANFNERNEYSVKENKIIRVLVKRKPNLNHSLTHIFLVWDTIRLLDEVKGITNIQEHETVEADITFKFNNKKYALEIERGELLRKKEQQKEKVAELNKKYPNRWMFIVSNKIYLSRYKKLGFATQRKQVAENLQKLLEK
jgi:hypothetical protein